MDQATSPETTLHIEGRSSSSVLPAAPSVCLYRQMLWLLHSASLCQSVRMPSSQERWCQVNPHQGWQGRLWASEVSNSSSSALIHQTNPNMSKSGQVCTSDMSLFNNEKSAVHTLFSQPTDHTQRSRIKYDALEERWRLKHTLCYWYIQ